MTLVLWVSPLCNSFARGQNGLWILRDLDLWPCACQCGFPPWLYTTVLWGLVHGCAECLLSSAGTVGCSGCLGSALPATEIGVALFPSPSYILWQTHSHTRWEYSLLLTCLVTTFIVIVSGFLFAFLPFFVLDCNLFVRPPNLSGLVLSIIKYRLCNKRCLINLHWESNSVWQIENLYAACHIAGQDMLKRKKQIWQFRFFLYSSLQSL